MWSSTGFGFRSYLVHVVYERSTLVDYICRYVYSHTLPIRVCAAQRGRYFEAPDLERGIHFRGVFWKGV